MKNQAALDFDIYSSTVRRNALLHALHTDQPALSERLKLIEETQVGTESYAYSVILMHPGTPLKAVLYEGPRDVAVLAIRIPDLIVRVQKEAILEASLSVYIYDSTDEPENPPFLGGAKL